MLRCEEGQSGPTYDSLQEVIDKKSFRPSVNLSTPTITNISFTLYAILGVNEKAQILTTFLWLRLYWFHEFLIWDPEACDGITKISLPVNDLWTPDIIVYEFVDDDVSQACPYVYVNHTGHIRYDRMLRLVSACNLQIFSFPFDIQNCSFTFGSYMHTIKDVRVSPALSFKEMTGNSKRYLQASGEWELVVILGNTDILRFGIDECDIITFWVVIKRRPILYVVNLIIPSSFLMIIDILSFYLPPHSVDRSSFKMTLILGYTVFLLIMNDLLPSTANGTPLIGIYFSVCLALMTISLLETVLITFVLHHNSMKYREVPHWVQVLVMRFIARLICYSFPEDPLSKLEGKQESNPWVVQPSQSTSGQQTSTNGETRTAPDVNFQIKSIQTQSLMFAICPLASGSMTLDVPELRQISQDLREINTYLNILRKEDHLQNQWCHVGYILDFLLFRIYLLIITGYALVIICMWCVWMNQ
ncbi:5-hydroxytryptamine receptor 3A-like [Carassius carassius]|uniref:5-hydroxytryptamine receptor 3A-like n=1 Tax=Carassius carassius TaxID=217509 RepID=UPI0028684E89|nr:5-hydroxytryptamine receptor 3A-like [Carassius carassius]